MKQSILLAALLGTVVMTRQPAPNFVTYTKTNGDPVTLNVASISSVDTVESWMLTDIAAGTNPLKICVLKMTTGDVFLLAHQQAEVRQSLENIGWKPGKPDGL